MVIRVTAAPQSMEESPSIPATSSPPEDTLADFLRLKISANTRRNYSKAIADFVVVPITLKCPPTS
jgi:hypothetical protein